MIKSKSSTILHQQLPPLSGNIYSIDRMNNNSTLDVENRNQINNYKNDYYRPYPLQQDNNYEFNKELINTLQENKVSNDEFINDHIKSEID